MGYKQRIADQILADLKANESDTLNEKTIYAYIRALKKIFVIEDSLAWNPNLRGKSAIRTSDTRYFTDPSIATAALGLGPDDLINDLNTFGLFFETLCVRDLRVYADALNGTVYHYRDRTGLECDAVVHLRNGSYGLIEIKLGGDELINEAAGVSYTGKRVTLRHLFRKGDKGWRNNHEEVDQEIKTITGTKKQKKTMLVFSCGMNIEKVYFIKLSLGDNLLNKRL